MTDPIDNHEDDIDTTEQEGAAAAAQWAEMADAADRRLAGEEVEAPDLSDDEGDELPEAHNADAGDDDEGEAGDNGDQTPSHEAEIERLNATVKSWENRYKSDEGRIRAAQRILDANGRGTLDQLLQPQQPPQGATSKGEQSSGAVSELLKSDEIKSFREEYPDIAEPVLNILEQMSNQTAEKHKQVDQLVSALSETERQTLIDAETQRLSDEVPNWQDLIMTTDNTGQQIPDPAFAGWVDTQPDAVKQMVYRNGNAITNANEVKAVLDLYQMHTGQNQRSQSQKQDAAARQKRKLDSARTVRGKGQSMTSEPSDPAKLWEQMAKEADARLQGRV